MTPREKEPRFDRRETQLVLRRAAQLQRAREADPDALSLNELEQIGQEVGLEPAQIRQAAQELVYERSAAPRPFLGAPSTLLIERTLPGELPLPAFETLLAAIQRTLPPGQSSLIGRTLTWIASPIPGGAGAGRSLLITISTADGETRIRLEEKLGTLAAAYFGGFLAGGGGGLGSLGIPIGIALHSVAAVFGFFVAMMLGSYTAARGLYRLSVRKRSRELQALFGSLCEIASSAIAASETPALPARSASSGQTA